MQIERSEMEAFLAVARLLSFGRAAKQLHLSPANLSKRVSGLEYRTKKKLFIRTTRIVRLTEEGERLVPVATRALESMRDADNVFLSSKDHSKIQGRIRLTCSNTLAIRKIVPIAASFHKEYPEIFLEFILNDGHLDLIEENLDMAVRIMTLEPSSLMVTKLGENPIVFCAAPKYLKKYPAIKKIEDLKKHEIIAIEPHLDLRFKISGKKLREVAGRAWLECMNGDLLVGLAEEGTGILVRSRWGVEKELKEGRLKEILIPDSLEVKTSIYAIYPENKYMAPRVRLWIDYLKQHYR